MAERLADSRCVHLCHTIPFPLPASDLHIWSRADGPLPRVSLLFRREWVPLVRPHLALLVYGRVLIIDGVGILHVHRGGRQ